MVGSLGGVKQGDLSGEVSRVGVRGFISSGEARAEQWSWVEATVWAERISAWPSLKIIRLEDL
jgi:hypothetical protein